ncbi:MAG: hypothetical protein GY851_19370 [bacterium]|nr:hypothetical protein [bacterium]
MADLSDDRRDDKTRPCPTCRMMISVLATKCRFCGDEVGRPKDEARTMTVQDLGGENTTKYAPSSTVMEALEAFRSEEEIKAEPEPEPEKRSILGRFGKKPKEEPQRRSAQGDLPELDVRSEALSSLSMPATSSYRTAPVVQDEASWLKRAGVFAGLVAAMVVLAFGAMQVLAMRGKGEDTGPGVRVHANAAEDLLAAGTDPLRALEEAVAAADREDHPENRKVRLQARQATLSAIQSALNATEWEPKLLTQASEQVNRALAADPCDEIRTLKTEVERECVAYGMVLGSVEYTGGGKGSAVFVLRSAGGESSEVSVTVGDLVADRFEVTKVGRNYVRVFDKKRNMRIVTWDTNDDIR